MEFFQNMACDSESVTYYFFPALYRAGLEHFLRENQIDGWEILSKTEVKAQLPDDFQYPEVRLSPTAPRIEKRVCCFVSHYDEKDFDREYQRLLYSQDWLDWHNQRAKDALEHYESLETETAAPSLLTSLLEEKNGENEEKAMKTKKPFFFCMTVCHYRTGAPLGKRCGVVFAESAEDAENVAWEKYGSDTACKLWVEEVPEDGFDFVVYKSEI